MASGTHVGNETRSKLSPLHAVPPRVAAISLARMRNCSEKCVSYGEAQSYRFHVSPRRGTRHGGDPLVRVPEILSDSSGRAEPRQFALALAREYGPRNLSHPFHVHTHILKRDAIRRNMGNARTRCPRPFRSTNQSPRCTSDAKRSLEISRSTT